MPDASVIPVPRQDPATTDQNIETLEQDRDGGGVRLVQTVAQPGITGVIGTHTNYSISANTVILAANEKRMKAFIRNMGTEIVYLSFDGGAAVTTTDMALYPSESFEVHPYTGAVNAIPASGTQDIRVLEFDLP